MRKNRTKRKKGTGQSAKSSKSWFSLDRWRDFVTNRGQGVSVFRATALVALVLVVLIGLSGFGFVAASLRGLPSLADIGPNPDLSTLVYDDQNQLVGQIHGVENRMPVKLSDIPQSLQDAFIAAEDHRFYQHHGVDLRGIMRALYVNVSGGGVIEGASTITQQLARNAFLTMDRTLKRKVQEAIVALELERRYTKKEILEMYLNQINFGRGNYGAQSAAQNYFGKDVGQLTLSESALLAGIVKSPENYNPVANLKGALGRRDTILNQMVAYNYIDKVAADQAKKEKITVVSKKSTSYPGDWFVDYVLQQLLKKYGEEKVYRGGLRVYTTLNLKTEVAAQERMQAMLNADYPIKEGGPPQPDMAAAFIDPQTGYIKAIIGGRTYDRRLGLDRAVASKRQPGSAMKPLVVYTPAIDAGFAPSYVVDDAPVMYTQPDGSPWWPQNYDRRFRGLMTIRAAVEQSVNVVAVKMLEQVGPKVGLENARRMGISTLHSSGRLNDVTLALALGGVTDGVIPLEMASAYGVLANGGIRAEPISILKVVDRNGTVLEEHRPQTSVVLKPETAWMMTNILEGVIKNGTGRPADIGRPAAGKTGTTTDLVDAWFVGYTPNLAGAVWMGYDQPKAMHNVYGSTYPAQVWKAGMLAYHDGKPVEDFPEPRDLVHATVCRKSGELAGPYCPPEDLYDEVFLPGTQPTQTCTVHVVVRIDRLNGKLATPYCPPEDVVTKVMLKRPKWVPFVDEKTGQVYVPEDAAQAAPTEFCDLHGPKTGP
ncbi:MAG: transglycosylase domain-containing protein [Bacillota bacterium]